MFRTKSYRRHQEVKARNKAMRSLMAKDLTEKSKRKLASTHCCTCSCHMCGNPRKYYHELTRQERKSIMALAEAIADL